MNADRIEMGFQIAGKSFRLSFPRQRFEQTVDRVDELVLKGKTIEQIEAKLPGKFERVLAPVKTPENTVKNVEKRILRAKSPEAQTPAEFAAQYSTMPLIDLIKKMAAVKGISEAAARYHITKARKETK